jgi:hypothetical protein
MARAGDRLTVFQLSQRKQTIGFGKGESQYERIDV